MVAESEKVLDLRVYTSKCDLTGLKFIYQNEKKKIV